MFYRNGLPDRPKLSYFRIFCEGVSLSKLFQIELFSHILQLKLKLNVANFKARSRMVQRVTNKSVPGFGFRSTPCPRISPNLERDVPLPPRSRSKMKNKKNKILKKSAKNSKNKKCELFFESRYLSRETRSRIDRHKSSSSNGCYSSIYVNQFGIGFPD